MQIQASSKSLRCELADVLTLAMITSARLAMQEYVEQGRDALREPAPADVERLKEFTKSAAYQHALRAYTEGKVTLRDLARAIELMRPVLPWLVSPT